MTEWKMCKGKTIFFAQCALAQRVRQNFLAEGRLTSSPPLPPPTPSGAPTDDPYRYRQRIYSYKEYKAKSPRLHFTDIYPRKQEQELQRTSWHHGKLSVSAESFM